jgi:mono/diheme cytochrome c family protein
MLFHRHTVRRRLITIALGVVGIGSSARPALTQEKPSGNKNDSRTAPTGAVKEGQRLFQTHCASCHHEDSASVAPDLRAVVAVRGVDSVTFHANVLSGRPNSGMPPFKGVLTDKQVGAIYEYVKERARQRYPDWNPR